MSNILDVDYKIKYLPAWVYAAVVKDKSNRELLLKLIDGAELYLFKEKDFDNDINTLTLTINAELSILFHYILCGNSDIRTGKKHRQGITGIGADEFIPNSIKDSRIIFEKITHYNEAVEIEYGYESIELYLVSIEEVVNNKCKLVFKNINPYVNYV